MIHFAKFGKHDLLAMNTNCKIHTNITHTFNNALTNPHTTTDLNQLKPHGHVQFLRLL